jgi:hypothetical protein
MGKTSKRKNKVGFGLTKDETAAKVAKEIKKAAAPVKKVIEKKTT